MDDTQRLDLLAKILESHELCHCTHGYTFMPILSTHTAKPLIEFFVPSVRELLDKVATLNIEEYK